MTGKLIVFEGIDKSGKETQARLLTNFLRDQGKTVATFSFPNYNSWSGERIKEWLHNKSICDIHEINAIYTVNRLESKETLERCLIDSDYVILDRYYYSNWVYGQTEDVDPSWLRNLDKPMPRPDKVFLLCISAKLSAQRGGSLADVYESDIEAQEKRNIEYMKIGNRLGWTMVDAGDLEEKIAWRIRSHFSPKLIT